MWGVAGLGLNRNFTNLFLLLPKLEIILIELIGILKGGDISICTKRPSNVQQQSIDQTMDLIS